MRKANVTIWSLLAILIAVVVVGCYRYEPDYRRTSNQVAQAAKKVQEIRVFLATADSVTITSSPRPRSLVTENSNIKSLNPAASFSWKIELKNNRWIINDRIMETTASTIDLVSGVKSDAARITTVENSKTDINASYRGTIRCYARPYGKIAVVNIVQIEDYINSVVGSEVYSTWGNAALVAQAVAARSYAVWEINKNSAKLWDIGDDQGSQCYKGISGENAKITAAVSQCRGLILTYTPVGSERPTVLPCFYSAICGGSTESGGANFNYPIPELPAKACPHCKFTAPADKYRWTNVNLSKAYVNTKLAKEYGLTSIEKITISQANSFGRIAFLTLTDKGGKTARISGEDFRRLLNSDTVKINSTWFEIKENTDKSGWTLVNGKGWGHGVGLCQRGAQYMAAQGYNDAQILNFYYPGAIIRKAY